LHGFVVGKAVECGLFNAPHGFKNMAGKGLKGLQNVFAFYKGHEPQINQQ
jgi:hypothetical protein